MLFYHAVPTVMKGGYFGVLIFFVLSGYLSAVRISSLFENGHLKFFRYYRKRFMRIYPALLIVLLASLGALALIDSFRMANSQQEILSIVLGYNNYWQIGMQADYFANLTNTSPFTHLWYIAILIQFDLLWPFLAKLYMTVRTKSSRSSALLLFLSLAIASYIVMPAQMLLSSPINITAVYYSTHTRLFALFSGVMLGLLHFENLHISLLRFRSKWTTRILYILFTAVTVWIFFTVSGSDLHVYWPYMQLYILLVIAVIEIMIVNRSHLQFFLDDRISNTLSKYSYDIYLWQYPVFFLTGILFVKGGWYIRVLQAVLLIVLSLWSNHLLARKK